MASHNDGLQSEEEIEELEDLIRLAELCVDLLRQNEEFYAEVSRFQRIIETSSML